MKQHYDDEYFNRLLLNPSESLSIEMKQWIDPTTSEGIAKIAKACIALRNNDGGLLLVGFKNNGKPDIEGAHANPRESFHADVVQGIVTKYSSEPFEVTVHYIDRDGQEYPILEIPSGFTKPVAAKKGLQNDTTDKELVKPHAVYVRTLRSNNTVSSSEARCGDWERIIELCFENREADIARFVRRHLASVSPEIIEQIRDSIGLLAEKEPERIEVLQNFVDSCRKSFRKRQEHDEIPLPPHGVWEAAFTFSQDLSEYTANRNFLNLIGSNNPRYTGLPLWADTSGFSDENARPRVVDHAWEVYSKFTYQNVLEHIDFWRITPQGFFYHRRAFEDDLPRTREFHLPNTVLDFDIPIWRVAEAIGCALSFAQALHVPSEDSIIFLFQWRGLAGRTLSNWTNPARLLWTLGQRKAYTDTIEQSIIVPVDAAKTSIAGFTHKVVRPLFENFDGFEIPEESVNNIFERILQK